MKLWIIVLVALAFLPFVSADCSDKEVFTATYNLCEDSRMYNPDCDFTGDGCVTLPDLVHFSNYISGLGENTEETTSNSKPSYHPSVNEVNGGYNKCIFEDRMVYFSFDGNKYILRTVDFYKNEVNIKITNLGGMTLFLGDEVELDLDKDGTNDVLLNIAEEPCDEDKIGLSLKYLSAQTSESLPEEEVVEPKVVEEKPSVEKPETKKPAVQSEPVAKEPENKLTGFVVAEEQEELGISAFFKKLFSNF
ncbi:hypothetical protein HOG16_00170 [Candidatus Woesearchaeota archaeon]|nr:hypothetical protein [Candidatus Woesearchaeota archaeon]MBT4322156.1 hypothetical protein [Candidatus Woesearchaeota archaeon]MBT4630844.1 hypothetical protein [Candidatus Woesearchaeota archaeon]